MIVGKNIKVSFGDKELIDNGNFLIQKGEKVGIIGDNGCGKTTLLRCIAGIQEYEGEISITKNTTIGYQEQDKIFPDNSTLIEEYYKIFSNIIKIEKRLKELENDLSNEDKYKEYLELLEAYKSNNGSFYKKKVKSVVLGLGFEEKDFNKPFKYFSGGELVKAAIGKIVLKNPDILLLDEPSNHLDIDSIEWLERFIKSLSSTVIIVSHDKYFLNRVVNKILEIEFRRIYIYNGNYDKYLEIKENKMKTLEKEQNNLIKEIRRNEQIIRRLRSFGREKHIKQAASREKKVQKLKEKIIAIENKKSLNIKGETVDRSGEKVLKVHNLSKSFDKTLFTNISFEIHRGEKIGLIGPNGSGKTTILKMIIQRDVYRDKIFLGYNVKIGYYDQKLEILDEQKTVFDNLKNELPDLEDHKVRSILGRYLFIGDDVFKNVGELSGGEKARLAFAKILARKPNFLILDEPTNHLDISSKDIITHTLENFDGTILLVSHDRYLLDRVCEKILVLKKDKLEEYIGNFTYYYNQKYLQEQSKEKDQKIKNGKIIYEKRKSLRRLEAWIKKKENELNVLEIELEKIETKLESLYSDINNYSEIEKTLNDKVAMEDKYLSLIEEIENLKNEFEKSKIEYENLN